MKFANDPTIMKSRGFQDCQLIDDNAIPSGFDIPNIACMEEFQRQAMELVKPAHGTTTLGFIFDGGIIVAVDSRASQGTRVSSQQVNKVITINKHMVGTMAGGAADCQFWQRYLGMQCRLYELQSGHRITIKAASKLFGNIMFQYRGMGLSVGSMVAGYDKAGPGLYMMDSDGQRTSGTVFSVGSGSLYAYGVLDSEYRKDLTVEEAVALGRRAIYHATYRDAASGGCVSVYHITRDGWKRVSVDDVDKLHSKFFPDISKHAGMASEIIPSSKQAKPDDSTAASAMED